jgi:hypothetical protein
MFYLSKTWEIFSVWSQELPPDSYNIISVGRKLPTVLQGK